LQFDNKKPILKSSILNKNILFISPSNSIHSFKWIRFIYKNSDFNITWVSFYKKNINEEIPPRIEYHEIINSNPLKVLKFLKSLTLSKNFIFTHLHYIGKFSYLLLFFKINNLIVSPWGSDVKFLNNNPLKKFIVKRILNKSNIVTVDAEFMREIIAKIIKNNKKIIRINFGTDTDLFQFYTRKMSFNKLKIISLRNLEKIYSIDTLIKAAYILKKEYSVDFIIDIYGRGSLTESLKAMIKSFDLESLVKIKGKFVYDDLPKMLKNYNLYVSTSTSDAGIAASTSEAMSTGLIPMIADNSENNFWVSNNSGFLFETKSPSDLANKIYNYSLLTEEIKNNLSKNAREKIVNHNSYSNEMNKMLKFYNALLNE
tara:strand:- start:1174 stop:2286 length:1113 start_codon:yes stop_codon:yes gene_type:complete